MGEESSQITRNIEETRAQLGSNLQELEDRVRNATDWRQQFQKRPFGMIGLAFGGGILLGMVIGRSHRSRRSHPLESEDGRSRGHDTSFRDSHKAARRQSRKAASETRWGAIKRALTLQRARSGVF